eukprot:5081486-Amphidinium_carterae.2
MRHAMSSPSASKTASPRLHGSGGFVRWTRAGRSLWGLGSPMRTLGEDYKQNKLQVARIGSLQLEGLIIVHSVFSIFDEEFKEVQQNLGKLLAYDNFALDSAELKKKYTDRDLQKEVTSASQHLDAIAKVEATCAKLTQLKKIISS